MARVNSFRELVSLSNAEPSNTLPTSSIKRYLDAVPDFEQLRLVLRSGEVSSKGKYKTIRKGYLGSDDCELIAIKTLTDPMIKDHKGSIRNEYTIGTKLNELRDSHLTPNFNYVYRFLEAARPVSVSTTTTESALFYPDSDPTEYLLTEYIDGISLKEFIKKCSMEELVSVLVQIFVSLWIGYTRMGYLHRDLHTRNVLMRKTSSEWLYYQAPNGIGYQVATFGNAAIIIDFERSTVDQLDFANTDLYILIQSIHDLLQEGSLCARLVREIGVKHGVTFKHSAGGSQPWIAQHKSTSRMDYSKILETIKRLFGDHVDYDDIVKLVPNVPVAVEGFFKPDPQTYQELHSMGLRLSTPRIRDLARTNFNRYFEELIADFTRIAAESRSHGTSSEVWVSMAHFAHRLMGAFGVLRCALGAGESRTALETHLPYLKDVQDNFAKRYGVMSTSAGYSAPSRESALVITAATEYRLE